MTTPDVPADSEQRVLILAPIGRDAELTRGLLEQASIPCRVCQSVAAVSDTLAGAGAGALLLTEEALDEPDFPTLVAELDRQPPWSEVPLLLFAGSAGELSVRAIRSIDTLRNVTLLERPIRLAAVLSTVRAALRSRSRQYEVRDLLVALHRARTEAESANRLKDEFLATLSHELRTPLNAILGWTSMLARGQIESDQLPRVFEALDRNAQAQAQLIADVLDVSRIITGKLQLQPIAVDIGDVVARAADAVRPAAAAKDIALTVRAAPDCWALGDPDRLQQVFWNLLSNAVKFTAPEGSIDVEVTHNPAGMSVVVSDTGVGMPPEFVPFVFDRFRQADQTTTRAHGGLGLGLSIVKHLTELHGGTVVATSEGVGRGSRFEVRLPAVAVARPVAAPDTESDATSRLDGQSILVWTTISPLARSSRPRCKPRTRGFTSRRRPPKHENGWPSTRRQSSSRTSACRPRTASRSSAACDNPMHGGFRRLRCRHTRTRRHGVKRWPPASRRFSRNRPGHTRSSDSWCRC